jgi:hypothetical protein
MPTPPFVADDCLNSPPLDSIPAHTPADQKGCQDLRESAYVQGGLPMITQGVPCAAERIERS